MLVLKLQASNYLLGMVTQVGKHCALGLVSTQQRCNPEWTAPSGQLRPPGEVGDGGEGWETLFGYPCTSPPSLQSGTSTVRIRPLVVEKYRYSMLPYTPYKIFLPCFGIGSLGTIVRSHHFA